MFNQEGDVLVLVGPNLVVKIVFSGGSSHCEEPMLKLLSSWQKFGNEWLCKWEVE